MLVYNESKLQNHQSMAIISLWEPLSLLLNPLFFSLSLSLSLSQFRQHVGVHYQLLCSLLALELKYEVRSLLRRIFVRIGQDFNIIQTVDETQLQPKADEVSTEAR